MISLPYLKKRLPRVAPDEESTESLSMASGGDTMESLLDQCAKECMDAIERKDPKAFRNALEAIVSDLMSRDQEEPKDSEPEAL